MCKNGEHMRKCVKVKERTHADVCNGENGEHRTKMCKGERTHTSTYNSQHFYTWMWKWSTQNSVYPIPIMTIATLQKVVHATVLWHSISIFFFLKWSVHIWKSIIYNRRDQDKHSRWWKKFEQIIILGLLCTLKDSKQNEFLFLQNTSPPWFHRTFYFYFFPILSKVTLLKIVLRGFFHPICSAASAAALQPFCHRVKGACISVRLARLT